MARTLKELIESDLDDVILTDFAEEVEYRPIGGEARRIRAIFDNEYAAVRVVGDTAIESTEPALICRTADIPGAAHNDLVVIRGVAYQVIEVQPDGTGKTTLILSIA